MNRKIIFYRFVFILISVFIMFLFGCSEDGPTNPGNQTPISDNVAVGEETQEITQDISPTGGTIIISNTGSVLNGMELIVPEKGYNENRTYIITSSPIISHKLGEYFNPVSPMITIKNGGGYSEESITIKVPINKNNDEFLMGFLYNEITGELEPLPVIDLDENFITVETRHFALSNITSTSVLGKISDLKSQANLIISSIKESILTNQNILNTGFTPGVDDWEFINCGSYISPGGHCAGQSMTAMWYYYEKKLRGEPALFHRYDMVNSSEKPQLLWQDNPQGYRFASTIQEDANWGKWKDNLKFQSRYPYLVWKTFIGAMLITGEPQSVIIRNSVDGGGHAMIVYKINISEGKLFIADPNYPNNRASDGTSSIRIINYINSNFLPYPSYPKVGDPGEEYDQIAFYSKTSIFDWEKIGERYKELENKTIGNDRFMQYDLYIKTDTGDIPFIDGMDITNGPLKLFCRNDNIPGFLPGTDRLQRIEIYDSNGNFITSSDGNGITSINLNSGENTFGIYICGYLDNDPNLYYDFKWVKVNNLGETSHGYTTCEVEVKYRGEFHNVTDYDSPNLTDTETTSWSNYGFTFVDTYSEGSFTGNTFTYEYVCAFDNGNTYDIHFSLTVSDDKSEITNIDYTYYSRFDGNAGTTENDVFHNLVSIPLEQVDAANNEATYYIGGVETCNSIPYVSSSYDHVIFDTLHSTKNLVDYKCDQNSYIRVKLK